MQKKKLLFIITKATWGGAQRYVYDLATHLPEDAFDVALAYGETGTLSQKLAERHIATHRLPSLARDVALLSDVRSFFAVWRLLRSERPDIVHLNSSKAAALGALAARASGVARIITTIHGWPFNENRGFFARGALYAVSWLTMLCSHEIIVVSKSDEALGNTMWRAGEKIRYIPLGIEELAVLTREEARARLIPHEIAKRHADSLWVVTNAELHPNKDPFLALDVVCRYNDSHVPKIFYCMLGDGDLRRGLDDMLTRRRMREEVLLLGFVQNAAQYLPAFDVFFLPSKKEGTPYAVLEAGAVGLPVVASSVGGIPDVVENGLSGILKATGDIDGFVEGLYELAKNKERRVAMGAGLSERVRSRFSFARMLEATISLYSALL